MRRRHVRDQVLPLGYFGWSEEKTLSRIARASAMVDPGLVIPSTSLRSCVSSYALDFSGWQGIPWVRSDRLTTHFRGLSW